jgi:hypothetical protein
MNAEELKTHFQSLDADDVDFEAWALLRAKHPTAERRFKRLTKGLADLMAEIKQEFPDACYYTGSGGFNLLIGPSHDGGARGSANMNYIALSADSSLAVGDGDF